MRGSTSILLCTAIYIACTQGDIRVSRVVSTAQGPVRGYKDLETEIYSFQSIPYASPPIGSNRYKAPLPPPTWAQPLDAIDNNVICPQADVPGITDNKTMNEDCLFINVHIPITEEKLLPVVVYVHGGGFQIGYGDMLIPRQLITEHNVIAVTFNYRLAVLGFLCLGTEDAPGNAGMKDQVAALRWVNTNIANFGGNPEEVTIAGYSAGSAAVDLLMLSKLAEGLFNKVIPESGASTAAWTIQSDPLDNAKRLAEYLNFTDLDNIYALEQFYKTVSYKQLNSLSFINNTDSTFGLSPCVERASGKEVFLDKSPVDILKSGKYRKVPLLYGFANMEGYIKLDFFDVWKNKMNEKFSDFLPANLEFDNEIQRDLTAQHIKEFYFGNNPVAEENILDYIDFFTDVLFSYSMLNSVQYHVEAGHDQVYLYEYTFVDDTTPYVPHTNVKGANHCSQTLAVFGGIPGITDPNNITKEFLRMSSIMRQIWGSFIKTGNPVPVGSTEVPPWPAVSRGGAPHMSLGSELVLQGTLLERRASFWDRVYSQHYRQPIPPPPISSTAHIEL